MGSEVKIYVLSLVFLTFFLAKTSSTKSTLYIFGDSILDAGNNNYINTSTLLKANFRPYGITFFPFPTGRFSDGRLISDFIAEHANLPLIPPFLQPGEMLFYDGVNFASAGAGALVQTFQGLVIDLHMQFRNYKKINELFIDKFGRVGAKKRLGSTVYLFSIGVNDYLSLFVTNSTLLSTYTQHEYVDMVVGNITSVITDMYRTGGRKFALLNVPQLACNPLFRSLNVGGNGDCLKQASSYAILHNQVLYHALEELKQQLPEFKYSLYDFYTRIQQIADRPLRYGYKEGKSACCGSGNFRGTLSCGRDKEYQLCKDIDGYLYWDGVHLTQKAYWQFADDMWSCANSSICYGQYSVKDLFRLP